MIKAYHLRALLCALMLAACGAEQPVEQGAAQPTPSLAAAAPTATVTLAPAPTRAEPTAVPTPGAGEFANPVLDQDFPDPDVLKVGDTYYAYATNTSAIYVQVASSTDLVHWQKGYDVLPVLPSWARPGYTWAPEVTAVEGGYALYFTARHAESGKQCVGVATGAAPDAKFTPDERGPLVCQLDEGGSIDPSSFADDDGARYLLWKNDGNCCGKDTWLYLQRVSPDGLTLEGEPTRLVKQSGGWEGILVEAPTLWKRDGKYYLFYSANDYGSRNYAVGYAVADAITGPYRKGAGPLVKSGNALGFVFGPGGQDVVVGPDGETWMLYHAWNKDHSYRSLRLDPLRWEGDLPVVNPSGGAPIAAP